MADQVTVTNGRPEEKKAIQDIEPAKHSLDNGHLQHERLDPSGKPLVPAVTSDPFDPLNFSKLQKWTMTLIVCFYYFLLTYLTTAPIASFSLLEVQFNASYAQVNWSFAIAALGLVFGPLATASLAETYGRRIVMIVSTTVAVIASGCTSIRGQSIGGYMAARFFQGFGAGPAANVGLSIINDISFEHERGFRIGLWAMSANIGSVLGGVSRSFLSCYISVFGADRLPSRRSIGYCELILGRVPRHDSLRGTLAP